MLNDIGREAGAGALYGLTGIALMALGYLVVDLLTPGRLGHQIWAERNRGAAIVLAAKLLGVGVIVTTAIHTSESGLGAGLASTAVYGLLGIGLLSVAFFVLDLVTPGKLGATVVEKEVHPACWVVACIDLATAAIVAAAIS